MKTVILVRHAKSSWKNSEQSDIERPLNKRGFRDSPFMGKLIAGKNIKPDVIISSPAVRALTTAKEFAKALNYPESKIREDIKIYEIGAKYIIKMLKEIDKSNDTVMVFGHNPDLTSLSSYLSGDYFDNVPTAGVVCIEFDINSWKEIEDKNGNLKFFEIPKKYFP